MEPQENPYSPPLDNALHLPASEVARHKLVGPALGLLITSSLSMLLCTGALIGDVATTLNRDGSPRMQAYFSANSLSSIYLPCLASLLGIYCGIQMLRVKGYAKIVGAAAICIVIPLFVIFLAIPCIAPISASAIWALFVLIRTDTRTAFAHAPPLSPERQ